MLQLSKIYAIKPIRYSIKMAICLMGVKVCGDLFYWAISGQTVAFPRYTLQQGPAQHVSNPPILAPYPYQKTMKHIEDVRNFDNIIAKEYDIVFGRHLLAKKMYKNVPQREDPNEIDHFMRYAQASRLLQTLYSKALRKINDSGANIPEGINQRIRELSQSKFKGYSRIQPQL